MPVTAPTQHNSRTVSQDSLKLQEFLPYRLSVLTNKVSRGFSGRYSRYFKLTIPEWRVMAVLGQEPDLSAEQVCRRTEMDKVSVSRAVANLLKKGYLLRKRDEDDRRRSILRLSKEGRGVYGHIIPLGRKFEARLVEVLSPEERRQLDDLLKRLDTQAAKLATENKS